MSAAGYMCYMAHEGEGVSWVRGEGLHMWSASWPSPRVDAIVVGGRMIRHVHVKSITQHPPSFEEIRVHTVIVHKLVSAGINCRRVSVLNECLYHTGSH